MPPGAAGRTAGDGWTALWSDMVRAYAAGEDHALVRRQIVADYEQDFVRLFGEESVDIATACLRSVANFVGGVSKNTSVVPVPGSRVNAKINEVFARLESWHLILRSDQKGSSALASHAYLPKRYLFDTGVLRELSESAVPAVSAVHTIAPAARTPLGAIIENQAAIELARSGQPLAGWKRSPAGSEIDFIVKTGPAAVPVECKASLTVNLRHMRGLIAYLRAHGQRRGYIASLAPYAETSVDGAQIVNLPPISWSASRVQCRELLATRASPRTTCISTIRVLAQMDVLIVLHALREDRLTAAPKKDSDRSMKGLNGLGTCSTETIVPEDVAQQDMTQQHRGVQVCYQASPRSSSR